MPTNFDAYVIGLFANNQSRNGSARLGDPDNPATWTWYPIESTNHDCVTNMLTVFASAYPNNGYVNVTLDDKGRIIEVTAWVNNMTQEESKHLTKDNSTNSITERYITGQVIGLIANNKSRTAFAWLHYKPNNSSVHQIESKNFDCVENMLTALARAMSTATTASVELDNNGYINYVAVSPNNMTQEEIKRLTNEG